MYRLRVIPIYLPALRERREDIALLCERLMQAMNKTSRRRVERVAPEAMSVLERYDWPGNVRELQNVLAYAYTIGDGPLLQRGDLPPELVEALGVASEPATTAPLSQEARELLAVLERTHGNKNQAAKVLGISRITLWRRLRSAGLVSARGSRET